MDFLIDECVPGKTKKLLKELGFSFTSVAKEGKTSASNGEVLNLAKGSNAILVTNDLHFSNILLYPLGAHSGIIVIRVRKSENPEEIEKVHKVLKRLLEEIPLTKLAKELTIVDRNKYRVHKR